MWITDVLMSDVERQANLMTSAEADFAKGEWTFKAPYFQCGSGEYLIISKRDWDAVKAKFSTELWNKMPTNADEAITALNAGADRGT